MSDITKDMARGAGLPGNVITHRHNWRKAIEMAIENAPRATEDSDEAGYWRHELAAFDRTFDRMWAMMEANEKDSKYAEVMKPFVAMMHDELHANADKGDRPGWLQMDVKTAILEIHYHLAKLQRAALFNDEPGVREYAADVANMAMMLVDVCGLLVPNDERLAPEQEAEDAEHNKNLYALSV